MKNFTEENTAVNPIKLANPEGIHWLKTKAPVLQQRP